MISFITLYLYNINSKNLEATSLSGRAGVVIGHD